MRKASGTEETWMREARAARVRSWVQIATACLLTFSATSLWGNLSTDEAKQHDLIRAVSKGAGKAVKELKYDSSIVDDLQNAANKGDAHAKRLLADALLSGKKGIVSKDSARARALYKEVAASGLAEGYLGQARIALREEVEDGPVTKTEDPLALLEEASARGLAKADWLWGHRLCQDIFEPENLETSWDLIWRAAIRGDEKALLEVGNSLLRGNWNGLPLEVDPELAEGFLFEATRKRLPAAALKLSQYLMADDSIEESTRTEEAVKYMYYAYLWAHEKSPGILQMMDSMGKSGELPAHVWIRARGLYEKSLEPTSITRDTKSLEPFSGKVRKIKTTYQKISGAVSAKEPMWSLLGFPLDPEYLWDGEAAKVSSEGIQLSMEDPYWNQAISEGQRIGGNFYVKVMEGAYAGLVLNVSEGWVPGADRWIELDEDISGIIKADEQVALGYYRTLHSIFGEYNKLGLRPGTGESDADLVVLMDTEIQTTEKYFFNKDLMAWCNALDPANAVSDFIIAPWEGIAVLRRDSASLYLASEGAVNDLQVSVPVDPGVNLLTNQQYRFLLETAAKAVRDRGYVAASSIPVYQILEQRDGSLQLVEMSEPASWWNSLGLEPDDLLYVNEGAVFILYEDTLKRPYLLQW